MADDVVTGVDVYLGRLYAWQKSGGASRHAFVVVRTAGRRSFSLEQVADVVTVQVGVDADQSAVRRQFRGRDRLQPLTPVVRADGAAPLPGAAAAGRVLAALLQHGVLERPYRFLNPADPSTIRGDVLERYLSSNTSAQQAADRSHRGESPQTADNLQGILQEPFVEDAEEVPVDPERSAVSQLLQETESLQQDPPEPLYGDVVKDVAGDGRGEPPQEVENVIEQVPVDLEQHIEASEETENQQKVSPSSPKVNQVANFGTSDLVQEEESRQQNRREPFKKVQVSGEVPVALELMDASEHESSELVDDAGDLHQVPHEVSREVQPFQKVPAALGPSTSFKLLPGTQSLQRMPPVALEQDGDPDQLVVLLKINLPKNRDAANLDRAKHRKCVHQEPANRETATSTASEGGQSDQLSESSGIYGVFSFLVRTWLLLYLVLRSVFRSPTNTRAQ